MNPLNPFNHRLDANGELRLTPREERVLWWGVIALILLVAIVYAARVWGEEG